jgi:hypothetical protein
MARQNPGAVASLSTTPGRSRAYKTPGRPRRLMDLRASVSARSRIRLVITASLTYDLSLTAKHLSHMPGGISSGRVFILHSLPLSSCPWCGRWSHGPGVYHQIVPLARGGPEGAALYRFTYDPPSLPVSHTFRPSLPRICLTCRGLILRSCLSHVGGLRERPTRWCPRGSEALQSQIPRPPYQSYIQIVTTARLTHIPSSLPRICLTSHAGNGIIRSCLSHVGGLRERLNRWVPRGSEVLSAEGLGRLMGSYDRQGETFFFVMVRSTVDHITIMMSPQGAGLMDGPLIHYHALSS